MENDPSEGFARLSVSGQRCHRHGQAVGYYHRSPTHGPVVILHWRSALPHAAAPCGAISEVVGVIGAPVERILSQDIGFSQEDGACLAHPGNDGSILVGDAGAEGKFSASAGQTGCINPIFDGKRDTLQRTSFKACSPANWTTAFKRGLTVSTRRRCAWTTSSELSLRSCI